MFVSFTCYMQGVCWPLGAALASLSLITSMLLPTSVYIVISVVHVKVLFSSLCLLLHSGPWLSHVPGCPSFSSRLFHPIIRSRRSTPRSIWFDGCFPLMWRILLRVLWPCLHFDVMTSSLLLIPYISLSLLYFDFSKDAFKWLMLAFFD